MSDVARDALLDKYTRMLALRRAHARGEPSDVAAVRALARAHPGALLELDRAPLEVIEARLAELAGASLPAWAPVHHGYHELMRIALEVRRVAGRDRDEARASAALAGAVGRWGLRPSHSKSLVNPPSGKLSVWVTAHLAEQLGLPLEEVHRHVFGHLRGRW